jgi:hypothetical protein
MAERRREATVQNLLRQTKEAREVSADMAAYRPDDKAWVYQVTYPEGKVDYLTRFSFAAETTLPDYPSVKLRPIIAFKGGFCVFSRSSLVGVEMPAGF